MDESRAEQHPPCSLCGNPNHAAIRDADLVRCPDQPLPAYVLNGLAEVERGLCWAEDPAGSLHCTQAPHSDKVDHLNAYTGRQWAVTPAT